MSRKYTELTSLHEERYGKWGGQPNGIAPDPARCAESVYNEVSRLFSQCDFKRGYGPEEAYCKRHDPAYKAKKSEERAQKRREQELYSKVRYLRSSRGTILRDALEDIAAGHNDPRTLARETLDSFYEFNPYARKDMTK